MELTLARPERAVLRELADEVCASGPHDMSESSLLQELATRRERIPPRIRTALSLLRADGAADYALICGLDIDEHALPPTPANWEAGEDSGTRRQEVQLLLLAACLGEPFGWDGQQRGRLVNDVVPVKADEERQINSGSREAITWHTEDAFQDFPSDYIGLLCLRNRDEVATGVSCARDWVPDPRLQPLFTTPVDQIPDLAYEGSAPPRTGPALFGDPRAPYVRLDPYFLRRPVPPAVEGALEALDSAVERTMRRVSLRPGDLLFVDNMRAVHARDSFEPRYDGWDRWLKRVGVSRDLRKAWPKRAGNAPVLRSVS
jgi:Taurine catabolism dioxygenase TauD, TfdA family